MSRILLSAYACEPGKGSEPAVGWMWATELAALGHEVWVITRSANRSAIEAALRSREPSRLHFVYCDLPLWARSWKKLPGAIYLYYFLWQWLAFRRARRLQSRAAFRSRSPCHLRQPARAQLHGMAGHSLLLRTSVGRRVRTPGTSSRHDAARPGLRVCPRLRQLAGPLRSAHASYVPPGPTDLPNVARFAQTWCRRDITTNAKCSWPSASPGSSSLSADASSHAVDATLRCVYVGRLLEWKGLQIALLAMQRLEAQGVPAQLDAHRRGTGQRVASVARGAAWDCQPAYVAPMAAARRSPAQATRSRCVPVSQPARLGRNGRAGGARARAAGGLHRSRRAGHDRRQSLRTRDRNRRQDRR